MKTTFRTAILVICVVIGTGAQGPDGRARAGATGLANVWPEYRIFYTQWTLSGISFFGSRLSRAVRGRLSLFGSLLGIVFPHPASHSHLRDLSEHYLEA